MRWKFLRRRSVSKMFRQRRRHKSSSEGATAQVISEELSSVCTSHHDQVYHMENIAFQHDCHIEDADGSSNDWHRQEFAMKTQSQIYFHDGRRRIDYVLVYEQSMNSSVINNVFEEVSADPRQNVQHKPLRGSQSHDKQNKKMDIRTRFLNNLLAQGLQIEEEYAEGKRTVRFVKIHAPWPILCKHAEDFGFRAPLKSQTKAPEDNWSAKLFNYMRIPNCFKEEIPNPTKLYYSYPFRKSKIDRFLGKEDCESYFTSTERSRIVHEILANCSYGDRRKNEVGVGRLLKEGIYTAAFPLHEGPFETDNQDAGRLNARQVLYRYWARWSKWYKYQPLDAVREYFGEKIAIYFAWLGFYTAWLIPVSIIGVLVFIYGLATVNEDVVSEQVCNSRGQFRMCPLCKEEIGCKYWDLSDICSYSRIAYLFDNPGTVAFAVFVSFWAVTFLEYWKRYSVRLAHRWDVVDVEREECRPRPEFAIKAPSIQKNPVTGIPEPAFPHSVRRKRIVAGIGFVFLMVCMVIIFIIAIIIYRIVVSIPLFQHEQLRSQAQIIANLSGAVVNLFLIMALGRFYEKLAFKLTSWEMHRTQTDFEDNLTFKVFSFQFVNLYASIFYIAFFKGRFVGFPGHYHDMFGLRNEDCNAGGCLVELSQQLAIIMIGKQVINNVQEILWPKVQAWWQNRKSNIVPTQDQSKRWEDDYRLVGNAGLFDEYLEMIMQFGFITIFVAAFPLAPLFALLNNVVEIRLDARKFICDTRRPVGQPAKDIGIWFNILQVLAHLAVISNAFLLAFTSEFLPKIVYQYEYSWALEGYVNFTLAVSPNGTMSQTCHYRSYRDEVGNLSGFYWKLLVIRLAFVIVFEHFVFGVCRLIDILVPDIPQSLEIKMKRERYLAKQILQDPDTLLKVEERETVDHVTIHVDYINHHPSPEVEIAAFKELF